MRGDGVSGRGVGCEWERVGGELGVGVSGREWEGSVLRHMHIAQRALFPVTFTSYT